MTRGVLTQGDGERSPGAVERSRGLGLGHNTDGYRSM